MPSYHHPTYPVQPGAVVDGKYELIRVIGEGGMGVVFEARHRVLGERVALKFLLAKADDRESQERFVREAKASARIKGENVTRVADVGRLPSGEPFMVMEMLDGCDLSKRLAGGPLPIHDALEYILQACCALAEAHRNGIIHRDLKPANLFLTTRADGRPLVKILDFGISKILSEDGEALTKTHAAMGSAPYMSPEQMRSSRLADTRTDVYALGITLFELLCRRRPFVGESTPQLCAEILTGTPASLKALRPDVPDGLVYVIERAFQRDPAARFQSIDDLACAIAPFAAPGSSVPAGRPFSTPSFAPGLIPSSAVSAVSAPRFDAAMHYAPGATGTNASISRTQPPTAGRSGGAIVAVIAGAGSLLALGAIGVLFATRGVPSHGAGVVAPEATARASAVPQAISSAAPAPTEPPAEAASASAMGSAAPPVPATASPPRGSRGARGAAPAPSPKPSSKPRDIFDGRQ